MRELKLKCKLITPLFMFGGDSKTPELRPSEFKGMMRWWWRAIKAENDIEKLRIEEGKIFGGTGKGEGRSKVRITINMENNLESFIRANLRTHPELKLNNQHSGIGYLLYSTILPRYEKRYIDAKYKFYINLSSYDEFAFKNAVAALWSAIYLGGFGTRARRGGGNLEILEATLESYEGLNFICKAKNVNELKEWLIKNLKVIKTLCPSGSGTSKYTTLKNSTILLFEPKKNWIEALNFLGEKYRNFRSQNKNKTFEVAVFGMPIRHRTGDTIVPITNIGGKTLHRFASPVIFKIIKGEENFYFPVVVLLNPGGVDKVGMKGKKGDGKDKIQDFKYDEIFHFFRNYFNPNETISYEQL